jgi:hypothetical protein
VDEVQDMIDMFHNDTSITDIAKTFKRSSRAVRFKLGRLGLMYGGRRATKSLDGVSSTESDATIAEGDDSSINELLTEHFIYGMLTGTFFSAGVVAFISMLKTSLLNISLQPHVQYNLDF